MVAQTTNDTILVLQQNLSNKLNNNVEDFELVDLLNNYSESLRMYNQDFVKSLDYCKIAQTISEKLNYENGLADSLLNIGACYVYMNYKHKPAKILKKSLALYRNLKDSKGEAQALIILGAAKLVSEDFVEAYDFLEVGLKLSVLTDYKKGQIIAYYKLAEINEKLQDFDSAIKFCKKALEISDDYDINVRIHKLFGSVLLLKSEIKEAKIVFNKALRDMKNYEDKFAVAQIHIEIGKIALIENDFESAKDNFDKGLCINDEIGLLEHSSDTFIEISDAYIEKRDFDSALEILKLFQNHTQIEKCPDRLALILIKMASINLNTGKTYETLNLLDQVWEIIAEGENLKLQYQCQEAYSEVFNLLEDFQAALKHYKLFYKYKIEFDQQRTDNQNKILTHRIKIEKQRDLKQLATLKNIEIAQTIYEVHEKSNDLFNAEKAISHLRSENELLHISNSNCLHCSVAA